LSDGGRRAGATGGGSASSWRGGRAREAFVTRGGFGVGGGKCLSESWKAGSDGFERDAEHVLKGSRAVEVVEKNSMFRDLKGKREKIVNDASRRRHEAREKERTNLWRDSHDPD